MNIKKVQASAGKRGEKIRSDCYIELEVTNSGGIHFNFNKVTPTHNESIMEVLKQMCDFFEIKDANIFVEDNDALPFIVAARFELAFKTIYPDVKKEFQLPFQMNNFNSPVKDRLRRSRLYIPGNEPRYFINAGLYKPDGIILDLEDSVAPSEKAAAQLLIRNALRTVDFYGAEKMVRINRLPEGLDDLKFIVPHNVEVILIPKCEEAQQVIDVETEIYRLKKIYDLKNDIFLMPIIETAKGVMNAFEIASASESNCALTIGLEDYTADIGVPRTNEGRESLFARSMIINSAKAAGLQAIDSVFSDIEDMQGLYQSVIEAKSLGFEGKGCIHPKQIKIIHEAFTPTRDEIEKAKKIIDAFEQAKKNGIGVVILGSKMIDAPVVKRAKRIIEIAESITLSE